MPKAKLMDGPSPKAFALKSLALSSSHSRLKTSNKRHRNSCSWSMVSPSHIYQSDVAAHGELIIIYIIIYHAWTFSVRRTYLYICGRMCVWLAGWAEGNPTRSSSWEPLVLPTKMVSSSFLLLVTLAPPTPSPSPVTE